MSKVGVNGARPVHTKKVTASCKSERNNTIKDKERKNFIQIKPRERVTFLRTTAIYWAIRVTAAQFI